MPESEKWDLAELANVAISILSAPIASAATERTVSTFSWMHSKKRNCLSSERTDKLTYHSYNWKLMNNQPKENMKKSRLSQLSSVQTQSNTDNPVEPSEAKARNDEDESYDDDIDEDQDIDITSASDIEKKRLWLWQGK